MLERSVTVDWISLWNTVRESLKNPTVTAAMGAGAGWLASSYFRPFFGELAKHHADRIKGHSQKKEAEQDKGQREERALDDMEAELIDLVHRLEDSRTYETRDRHEFARALARLSDFFEPHHRIKQLSENREFLRAYAADECINLVSRGLADEEIPRIINAARELRIRRDRPVHKIES
jgi:hypothetical protein